MQSSKIKKILEQHKLWLWTYGEQGKLADLSSAKLRGAKLEYAILRDAYLTRANLADAKLTGAVLMDAELEYANLSDANLDGANLSGANLTGANLTGAKLAGTDLEDANLKDVIGLPDISWIIPGCLAQLNEFNYYGFYIEKEGIMENFIQDSFGFIIQNNSEEKTFDMLVVDRIIRGIPDWVKYSGLKIS